MLSIIARKTSERKKTRTRKNVGVILKNERKKKIVHFSLDCREGHMKKIVCLSVVGFVAGSKVKKTSFSKKCSKVKGT